MEYVDEVAGFLRFAQSLRVLLVGGAAVNFHGYQRQSADVDLWVEPVADNFDRLERENERSRPEQRLFYSRGGMEILECWAVGFADIKYLP